KLIRKGQIVAVLVTSLLLPFVLFSLLVLLFWGSSRCEVDSDRTELYCPSKQLDLVISVNLKYDSVCIWRQNVFNGWGGKLGPPWWTSSMSEVMIGVIGLLVLSTV